VGIVVISVIVPVYNTEKYLKDCVESIYQSGIENIECILIDDGSIDASGRICDELQELYKNLKVIHTVNKGVSNARNMGLQVANGDYVTFVDGDDLLSRIDDSFFKSGSDVYCLGMQMLTGKICREVPFYDSGLENNLINYPVYMNSVCNKFFKLNTIRKYNLSFDTKQYATEDLLFFISYMLNVKKIEYISQAYYQYRVNNASATHKRMSVDRVSNNYNAYLSIKSICDEKSNNLSKSRFMRFLRLKMTIPYLTEMDFYNPKKFRQLTNKGDIWTFNSRIDWTILTISARLKIDIVSFIYSKIKSNLVNDRT
jgi:Glycosyltransferases involved in cell wall biogenesis